MLILSMTKDQIKHMVDRFLGWRLPDNFSPDCGISYTPLSGPPQTHKPLGTNLFDATQADAMVRYMVQDLPPYADDFRWLIEAPGQKYLAVEHLTASATFKWTHNHNEALAFRTEKQADDMMVALRTMDRLHDSYENNGKLSWGKLFAFEPTLGNAKAVEHAWMS